jgi:hypothetical protein
MDSFALSGDCLIYCELGLVVCNEKNEMNGMALPECCSCVTVASALTINFA